MIQPGWKFDLARHDDDPAAPAEDPNGSTEDPADPQEPSTEPDKGQEGEQGKTEKKDGSADAAKWKALARKHEAAAKTNAAAAKRLAEIEEEQKTAEQKLAERAEAAEQRAVAAVQRAVRAEVKALAAADFADPSDAVDALKAEDYVTDDGDVDTGAIKMRLSELLDAKPHWRKAESKGPAKPKPDPSQGARGGGTKPANFKDASPEEVRAELARLGVKTRS
ncbi:hypothetical protein [Actinosynnema mirum]|uniref:Scaffolding protein n=1 Tax=Actinosynnema mirum (strain ATCC 29888 / DSM 43827 / JCM 3225 / NBRC 14064 / NCIMB 13271 / NRRL B-12336 / IMRU 3971 / 101) TaxID=446462 RepID=C6WC51_ACTMD|nr:hypothetical protein [Actinosynnema mirum]ACU39439.1 hypothetical protein Amir_5623 [Actinosynnema mirum DSM 43827]